MFRKWFAKPRHPEIKIPEGWFVFEAGQNLAHMLWFCNLLECFPGKGRERRQIFVSEYDSFYEALVAAIEQTGSQTHDLVNLEEIRKIESFISETNKLDLKNVMLVDGIKTIPISQEVIDKFKYTGLGNWDFFKHRFWEVDNG